MRFQRVHTGLLLFAAVLAAAGLLLDAPQNVLPGLRKIIVTEDTLITDYIEIAGLGAAFVNAALILAFSVGILALSKDVVNGFTIAECGLMVGFALFGKNIANIWPIILGAWLYAKYRREPFSKYAGVALLATALSPMVSFLCLYRISMPFIIWGVLTGVFVGFVLPSLSAYTFRIQNGMNIYNMGFACGILALATVPLIRATGAQMGTVLHWATGYNLWLGMLLGGICAAFILLGTFACGVRPGDAWRGYGRLLKATGRAPSDFLRMFDSAPVLINMGIDGLLATAYILLIGGDLNGPTLGAIFTVIGFSAYGKHARNIVPVMSGVVLGSFLMQWELHDPAIQLAGLFCTALAPISGHFGWPYGVLAGLLHSCIVLYAGSPVSGLNLYNNGFAAGLLAIVLYPTITAIARQRKPVLQNEDYFDVFEHAGPIDAGTIDANEDPPDAEAAE